MRSFVGAVRAHVRARYARRRDGVVVLLLLAASSSRAVFARTRPRPRAAARRGGARTRGSGAKHGIAAVGVRRGAFCARGGGRRGRVVVLFCRVRATFVPSKVLSKVLSYESTKVRKYFRTFENSTKVQHIFVRISSESTEVQLLKVRKYCTCTAVHVQRYNKLQLSSKVQIESTCTVHVHVHSLPSKVRKYGSTFESTFVLSYFRTF